MDNDLKEATDSAADRDAKNVSKLEGTESSQTKLSDPEVSGRADKEKGCEDKGSDSGSDSDSDSDSDDEMENVSEKLLKIIGETSQQGLMKETNSLPLSEGADNLNEDGDKVGNPAGTNDKVPLNGERGIQHSTLEKSLSCSAISF